MGVVIEFPQPETTFRVMCRTAMKDRFDTMANWLPTASGRGSYMWLDPERWVMVYRRASGGWTWGSGLDADRRPEAVTAMWSPRTFANSEAARRQAWAVVIERIERSDDKALRLRGDDGDAA